MSTMKGEITVVPPLRETSSSKTNRHPSRSSPPTSPTEKAGGSAPSTGHISSSSASKPNPSPLQKKTPKDFKFGKLIGEGSFSMVYLAKEVNTDREYAIKVCEKRHIIREKKQASIKREKEVLNMLNSCPCPFFVKLYCTFQDNDNLFFVLTYAKNGELLPYINKVGSFDVECTRFYSAEIVLALEQLHTLGIIHRDLKPENILLSESMHIQITDFGSAKIFHQGSEETSTGSIKRNSFVGTAQYVSPELLNDKAACKSSDLWALGCIIYQLLSGLPPFRAPNEYLIFQKIMKLEYDFPDGFDPIARDLVEKLLVLDHTRRLGCDECGGYVALKRHPFFNGIDWANIHKQNPPPIYPYLPATGHNEEHRSNYRCWLLHDGVQIPDNIEPGLDDRQMTRLLGLELGEVDSSSSSQNNILNINGEELERKIALQAAENPWHKFVEGNLILKMGLVDKRKGLFARRRMLLLTSGPHLYYVDPNSMILKGEIPWSCNLRAEPKNFKTFFVHTPNRTYYLEDSAGYALEWCKAIEEVRMNTYRNH